MSRRTYRWLPAQVCRTARYWVALSVVLSLVGTAAIAQDFDPSDAASVMPTTRYEFNGIYDSVVDLRVKVLGGFITVHRTYNRGNTPESQLSALFGWDINPELSELRAVAPIRQECGTGVPDKMVRGRTSSKYERIPGSCPARYTRDDGDKTITMTVNGWRWESRAGDWVDYDNVDNSSPKPTAYGDRNGLIASILRDGLGRLIGFADRLGRQVVTFDWASPDSLLVRDYAGRQV